MADLPIDDLNVFSNETLITPEQLKRELPLTASALKTVSEGRQVVRDILDGKDHRLFVVIGPCSIHDLKAAHEYGYTAPPYAVGQTGGRFPTCARREDTAVLP